MNVSTALKVTLAMLAASAVASAEPPRALKPQLPERPRLPSQWIDGAPRTIAPVLSPPGLTPTIDAMYCTEDPHEKLRTDCFVASDDVRPGSIPSSSSPGGHSQPVQDQGVWEARDPDHGRAFRADQAAGHSTSSDWYAPIWRR